MRMNINAINFIKLFKEKKITIFFIVGLLGLLLILCSDVFFSSGNKNEAAASSSIEEYQTKIQQEVKELAEKIEGAGSCEVFVTLESGPQYIYATENRNNINKTTDSLTDGKQRNESSNDLQSTYILVRKSDGSEEPILLQEISPVVRGVVILCKGGGNAAVQQMITEAVTTAFHISSSKVSVILKA